MTATTEPKAQPTIDQRIADELGVTSRQVSAAVELLDNGSTVPFIARYRKEATGALDDTQLRTLEDRLRYLRELEERRFAQHSRLLHAPDEKPALLKPRHH